MAYGWRLCETVHETTYEYDLDGALAAVVSLSGRRIG